MSMGILAGAELERRADINVTPLIDVLLVFLIIFMVITPLTPYGLDAMAPQPPTRTRRRRPEIRIAPSVVIAKDKSMKLNQDPITENRLGARLKKCLRPVRNESSSLRPIPISISLVVAHAIDIAKGAGIDKIGLMTPKIEEGHYGSSAATEPRA